MARPSRKISDLPCAKRELKCVAPNASIREAASIMLLNDFSQLPVVDEKGKIWGILRWPSLVKGFLDGKPLGTAKAWAVEGQTMRDDRSIYDAFEAVLQYEYVVLTNQESHACGIVTVYDLANFANESLVPYLLVEGIELELRDLIERTKMDLEKRTKTNNLDDRSVPSFERLIRVLDHADNWAKIRTEMSKEIVLKAIDTVRTTRNRLMHFKLDQPLDNEKRTSLAIIARFLDQVGLDGPREFGRP